MSKIAVIGLVGNSAFLSVDSFHKGGETVVAKEIHFEVGGKGYNQAVAAARFGAEVSFLGAVGEDFFGEVKNFSEKENIKPFLIKKEGNTAYASIITDKSGETHVTVYQGVSLSEKDVDVFENEIKTADILLINNEVPKEVNIKGVKIAKENGVRIIMNPAPYRDICSFIKDNVSYFTPNEHETKGIENKRNLIVTLGAKGCFIKEKNKSISPINVNSIDATGAGDTFNGVLASMLGDGNDLETAVKYAVVASGLSVTKRYAVSSIPKREEIELYVKKQEKE